MKTFCYIILLQTALFSCTIKQKANQSNPNLSIINLDNMDIKENINASYFFKNPRSIILETSTESLIGEIDQLYIDNNYIIIFDHSTNLSILVFNIDGTYSHKIGKPGQGPHEYISITDFTVDSNTQEIYLLDSDDLKIKKYNLHNGKFIKSIPINEDRCSEHIQYQNNSLYIDANNKSNDKYLLYQIDKETGKEIACWLDADRYNRGWMESFFLNGSFFLSRNAEQVKFAQVFMDTIVAIQDRTVSPFMVIKSERWIKHDEMQKVYAEYGMEAHSKIIEQNKIFGITDLIETNRGIFFTYRDGFGQTSIYNSKQESFAFKTLIDDLVYKENRFPLNLKWSDTKGVYTYCNPLQYASFAGKTLKEIINTNVDKYDELINLPEDANPVIFYYEFKD